MKIELSTDQAADILLQDDYANWSRVATYALIEYYEALEEDLGESIDLDRVALRCEWSEYKSASEAYKDRYAESMNETEARVFFEEYSTVIPFEGGILIQQF